MTRQQLRSKYPKTQRSIPKYLTEGRAPKGFIQALRQLAKLSLTHMPRPNHAHNR